MLVVEFKFILIMLNITGYSPLLATFFTFHLSRYFLKSLSPWPNFNNPHKHFSLLHGSWVFIYVHRPPHAVVKIFNFSFSLLTYSMVHIFYHCRGLIVTSGCVFGMSLMFEIFALVSMLQCTFRILFDCKYQFK